MAYLSDIEIAQQCKMKPITEIAKTAGIADEYLEQYGKHKAKIELSLLKENTRKDGKLIPREKHRGKAKVIRQIVKKMEEHAEGGLDYSGKCYISHSACLEDAQAVAKMIEERFPKLDGKVSIYNVGTTIGSHTGPGTVALFFWGSERTI